MSDIVSRCQLSVRVLLRRPARAIGLTLLLGACIAFNGAVFAVVDGAVFKALPFPAADRLVTIGLDRRGSGDPQPGPVSGREVADLRQAPSVEVVEAWTSGVIAADRSLDDGVRSVGVTAGFFGLAGAVPMLGRTLRPEDRPSGSLVPVVIGHRLWRARFGGASAVFGRPSMLGGVTCEVVGVAPPGFEFPNGANVWNLATLESGAGTDHRTLMAIARLRQGASCRDATGGTRLACQAARQTYSPRGARSLLLVLAAGLTLLAMTWFQVACLELARALTRIREIGVKLALGATRRALAIESLCQGAVMAGGALGLSVLFVPALLRALVALLPSEVSFGQPIAPDWRTFGFGTLLACGGVGAFVAVPFQALARSDAACLLRGSVGARRSRMAAPWMIVLAQVALSTLLVYVAGLTVRSTLAVDRVDFGYAPIGVLAVRLPGPGASGGASVEYERVADQIRGLPSVAAVAGSCGRPLGGATITASVARLGDANATRARMVCVTPGYLHALGLPLRGGRDFQVGDIRGSGFVVILNRPLASRLGIGRWAEGHRISLLGFPARVVGIVGDAVLTRPDDPDQDVAFVPATQWVPPTHVIVRTVSGEDGARRATSETAVVLRQMAPPGSFSVVALADEVRRVTAGHRARATLLVALATIGIGLCTMGVYGAVAYACESRRRAVAIRLAVGASTGALRRQLLEQVMIRVGIGLAAGVCGGLTAGRLGSAMLFGIAPADAVSVVAAVGSLAVACACAVAPSLLRIARVQPSEVLREE